MDEIFSLQAEVLKVLSSPRRLEIIHRLAAGPVEVSRLAEQMGVSQPNVSQHLAVMRAVGLVDFEREGREVRYRLVDGQIIEACNMMRRVLQRRLARMADLSTRASEGPISTQESNGPEAAATAASLDESGGEDLSAGARPAGARPAGDRSAGETTQPLEAPRASAPSRSSADPIVTPPGAEQPALSR